MPFLGIDKSGQELIWERADDRVVCPGNCLLKVNIIPMPSGSIKKLIGREMKSTEDPFDLSKINDHGKL